MKLILRGVFATLLILAGLMFMRVIIELTNNETSPWADMIMRITDRFCMPIAMMMFGDIEPHRVLVGSTAIIEPQTLVALFVTLMVAFTLLMVMHAYEDRRAS